MKKHFVVAAMSAFLVYGCSEQMNPVEPVASASVEDASVLAKASPTTGLVSESVSLPVSNIITASKLVTVKDGGTVALKGSFTNTAGEQVDYNLSIYFAPGDLPSNQTISISIDKTSFADNGSVQFGPSGLVFTKPATLFLYGKNVQIAKKAASVTLLYWDGKSYVPYPDSWGQYTPNYSGVVFATGKIPHFSRYAFGR